MKEQPNCASPVGVGDAGGAGGAGNAGCAGGAGGACSSDNWKRNSPFSLRPKPSLAGSLGYVAVGGRATFYLDQSCICCYFLYIFFL